MGYFEFADWRDFICDFLSGSIAGAAFVISSQPFEFFNFNFNPMKI